MTLSPLILYSVDYRHRHADTDVIRVKGWYVDNHGRRHQVERYVKLYSDESIIETAKNDIDHELLGNSSKWKRGRVA